MGRQKTKLIRQSMQMGSSIGLMLAGLIAPAVASSVNSAQALQFQAEAFSRSCVERVAQAAQEQDLPESFAICQQAIALTQITDNQRLEAYSLGNLGTLYLQQQNYQQALTVYQQALTIAEMINDPALRTKTLVALGTVYLQTGQHQQALEFYQQALTNAQSNSDPTGTAIAHYNLGLAYDTTGQYQQSVDAYQIAAQIAQEVGDPILETYALSKMKLANQSWVEANEQAKL